jgi:hypothetical protein
MAYVRRDSKDTFVILANRLGSAQTLKLNMTDLNLSGISALTDLLTGTKFTVSNGILTVTVPAYSGLILKNGTASKVTLSAQSAAALRPAWTDQTQAPSVTWSIAYSWNFTPPGAVLPTGASVANGSEYTVDTVYHKGYTINNLNSKGETIGRWVFSGWSNTGTLTVTGDVRLTGSWSYEEVTSDDPVKPTEAPKPTTPTVPATTVAPTVPVQPTTPADSTDPGQTTEPGTTTVPAVPTNPEQTTIPDTTVPATGDATQTTTQPPQQTTTEPPVASTEPENQETTVPTEAPGTTAPGATTDPTVTTTQPNTQPSTQPPAAGGSGRFPWWGILLMVLAVAAAGVGGWFGYSYIRKKNTQ